jgi:hypothetical protein
VTHLNRGLDLSDVSSVTGQERDQFSAFYTSTLGHPHRGLDYLLEEDPATLKRYRHYSNVATPNNYESERRVFVFGFLPFYAETPSAETPSASAAAIRPKQIDSDRLAPLAGYSSPTASPSSPAAYSPGIGSPNASSTRALSSLRGPPQVLGPPGNIGTQ